MDDKATEPSWASLSSRGSSVARSMPEEDDQMEMLSDIKALRAAVQGVVPTKEPAVLVHPNVIPTDFSEKFDFVMGLYRTMTTTFRGCCSPSSPQWLLLTAFVIKQNPSIYSAWSDRRNIVLTPSKLLASTLEIINSSGDGKDNKKSDDVQKVLQQWLPTYSDVIDSASAYSVWRAVRWELRALRCFVVKCPKNFQVWHHREELLRSALAQLDPAALDSEEAFNTFLLSKHDIKFEDIDERVVCDYVLESDSKNYHTWLYRSWFVHAFTFLLRLPSWNTLLQHCSVSAGADMESVEFCGPLAPEEWLEKSLEPMLPECPLNNEMQHTAKLIREDCLNNSAWCHRFLMFEQDVIGRLIPIAASNDVREGKTVLYRLSANEIHYALRWCYYEPCNESPFVHARSVAIVHQASAVRFYLSMHAPGVRNWLHDTGAIIALRSSTSDYQNLREKIPWEAFLDASSLLIQQLEILQNVVVPRAEEVRRAQAERTEEAIAAVRAGRSQFLLDNAHQVYVARYRILFTILECMWCCYFTQEDRMKVNDVLPPEVYSGGSSAAAARVEHQPSGYLKFFLETELQALQMARRVLADDIIRIKYWKNELNIVIHRSYM